MAPADTKKLLDPKLNKNKTEFDQSGFINKETVCALQHLYVKHFHQKIRIMWVLRSILNLLIAFPPFYLKQHKRSVSQFSFIR